MSESEVRAYLGELKTEWKVLDNTPGTSRDIGSNGARKIQREFTFKSFVKAMAFVDRVADIAEIEDHHPDIHIYYNRVVIELWTHAIGGLSENDFIVAAKIETMM
ncbi:MAG: hypothetical protein G01um101433_581 [Parcubacteria group bacterium Gr01-1014_33]|nr:MAG: hypothetical protein G01um101433_581 [Parcubacteria group bacterium Gr01-1014_33]